MKSHSDLSPKIYNFYTFSCLVFPLLKEQIHSLKYSPGTHGSWAASLIGKLEVIKTKVDTKKNDENPIKKFQDDAADSNASVVFADVDAT